MGSEARALLAQLTEERGAGGVLRIDTTEGLDLPPGSMAYPPCQCPQHRAANASTGDTPVGDQVRAANPQSGSESQ